MQIQFCTTTGFLSYIAKYISKPEPYGTMYDNEDLRKREKLSPQTRFLCARVVGAPEAVYRALGFPLKSSANAVHLPTEPPERRLRAQLPNAERARREKVVAGGELTDEDYELRFYDGHVGEYAKRPHGEPFENMLYPDFHSKYQIRRHDKLTQSQLELGLNCGYWLLLGQGEGVKDEELLEDEVTTIAHFAPSSCKPTSRAAEPAVAHLNGHTAKCSIKQ